MYSEVGVGTTFKIYLPRYLSAADVGAVEPATSEMPTGSETVLVVEDELAVLDLATAILQQLGYTVLAASSPMRAISLAEEYAGEIDLLLSDVIMPDMSGREAWEHIKRLRPGIRCLFISGYTADVIADHGVLKEGVHLVQKPFTRKVLATKIREALSEEC